MFSVLDGLDNFTKWVADGPVGWIVLNPLFLSIFIVIMIMFLHEYYIEDEDDDLTKFAVYSFLIIFVPIMINNNVIDRKRIEGSFDINTDDFLQ